MTKLECVGPAFTYSWPGGTVRLAPGYPVELPEDRAARLLAKAPGRVRIMAHHDTLQVGQVVEWDSPLFGCLRGVVLEVTPHTCRIRHPLTECVVPIPRSWLRVPL